MDRELEMGDVDRQRVGAIGICPVEDGLSPRRKHGMEWAYCLLRRVLEGISHRPACECPLGSKS